MGKRNAIIMLCVAAVFALLAAFMAYGWLQKKTAVAAASKPILVAVASADLKVATNLTPDMIKTAPYLKTSLPEGYFTDASALKGRTIIYPVKAGELLLESKLAPASIKGGGVAAIIAPTKRAMAVKVDKVVGVSGFINPGHHVDVLVTLNRAGNADQPITKIVLENMLVLAIGTEIEKTGEQDKPKEVDVVTMEVTPQEAEKLAHASNEGKLRLALRNYTDKENVSTRGETIQTLLASNAAVPEKKPAVKPVVKKAPPPPAPPKVAPKPPTPAASESRSMPFTIDIINGAEKREVTFGNGGAE